MKTATKLRDLAAVSGVMLDHKLASLRAAQAARQSIAARIASLDLPVVAVDLPLAVAQRADVNYQIWADQRRMQLNLQLAQATAAVLQAEAEARVVFAKNSVLTALQTRLSAAQRRPC